MSALSEPPRIHFFCVGEPNLLQDDIVCLAEGLRELGVEYSASANYWRNSLDEDDWLFRADPSASPLDCDAAVFPRKWFEYPQAPWLEQAPAELFAPDRRRPPLTIYIDQRNGWRPPEAEPWLAKFDLVLRGKMNARCPGLPNFRPWVLGLTRRSLEAVRDAPPFEERERTLLWNFGASHAYPHGSREAARRRFAPAIQKLLPLDETRDDLSREPADPYERLMWRQTIRRHSRAYCERLKASAACAAFCGDFAPPFPFDPSGLLAGGRKARLRRAGWELAARFSNRPPRLIQWDSWRFWEAMAAGCAAFHFDLEACGVAMPSMPENWRHYVGVDPLRPAEAAERLADDPGLLERVAREGQAWALENGSPRAMALRLLRLVRPGFQIPREKAGVP